ncbi:MAG: response regulator [Kordiimonadaceae bacterium]|nr:response regulator [Kordiimonadaceae bacterium]
MLGCNADLRVLIALANGQAASGARAVFKELGADIYKVAEGKQSALELMENIAFNLLLIEDTFSDLGGVDFVRYVRMTNSPVSVAPVILAMKNPDRNTVVEARDAGVNKMVIMPFNTTSLLKNTKETLSSALLFIRVTGYSGPCRRQKVGPVKGAERRIGQQGALSVEKQQKLFKGL